jgi:hypothetical protein
MLFWGDWLRFQLRWTKKNKTNPRTKKNAKMLVKITTNSPLLSKLLSPAV